MFFCVRVEVSCDIRTDRRQNGRDMPLVVLFLLTHKSWASVSGKRRAYISTAFDQKPISVVIPDTAKVSWLYFTVLQGNRVIITSPSSEDAVVADEGALEWRVVVTVTLKLILNSKICPISCQSGRIPGQIWHACILHHVVSDKYCYTYFFAPKWDKSGTFSDQISVHFGPLWPTFGPKLTSLCLIKLVLMPR